MKLSLNFLGNIGFDQKYERHVQRDVEIFYCGEQGKISPLDNVKEPDSVLREVLTSRSGGKGFGSSLEKPWEGFTVYSYRSLGNPVKEENVAQEPSESALNCE